MPALTRKRIIIAFSVAVTTDIIQVFLGPLGWTLFDEIGDLIAMGITIWALGFHPLLLPTFILELIPFVDMLPTWTGCVAAVVMLQRQADMAKEGADSSNPPTAGRPICSKNAAIQPPPATEPRRITEEKRTS